jgi:hypothetical protein
VQLVNVMPPGVSHYLNRGIMDIGISGLMLHRLTPSPLCFEGQSVGGGSYMREISPAVGISVDDWIRLGVPPELKGIIDEIRRQKRDGERPKPSTTVIDRSTLLSKLQRGKLLDEIAAPALSCGMAYSKGE